MGQYIEGLTKIPKPIPAEKIREQRELEEKQRAMERKIRALKRKVEGTQDEKKVKEISVSSERNKASSESLSKSTTMFSAEIIQERRSTAVRVSRSRQLREQKSTLKATDTESKNPVPTNKEPNIPQPDNNVSKTGK